MKILYVKNNSERDPKFQLKTIIYEKNNQKFIKKQALTLEAIPHLKKMKESYKNLSSAIVHPNLKLAKIIDESTDSLTFEFIEGESLETKLSDASKINNIAQEKILDKYITLVKTAFKTIPYSTSIGKDPTYKTLFGNLDFSMLHDETFFANISNIDLIFSNIIYADDTIYLIDYEWAYETPMPINYIIHRTISMLPLVNEKVKYTFNNALLYHKMERHFIDSYVMNDGFYFQKHQYIKTNAQIIDHIKGKEAHIDDLKNHLEDKRKEVVNQNIIIKNSEKAINLRDKQINFLFKVTDSLRVSNRIRKIIPSKLLKFLGKKPYIEINTQDYPLPMKEDILIPEQAIVYHYQEPIFNQNIETTIHSFQKKPLISIIMPVYNVDPEWLELAIKSVQNQWYSNWELCIADDKSTNKDTLEYLANIKNKKIKIIFLENNLNISGASNAALSLASGEYISLLDNDDELTPDALYEMIKVINEKDSDFIYSDEDFITTNGELVNPHFKPDFSPDLLLSHNYITHFTCFKRELLDTVGHFNSNFDGSQDYDLFLRLTEQTSKIHHIQKVLYHWRMLETSTSANSEAKPEAIERGKQVLETTLTRRSIQASIQHANKHHYFRVKYNINNNPLVSIIIPFKDKPKFLDMCINSILDKSTYTNYEIIGISNNSEESSTFEMMLALEKKDTRISFYEYNTEFNYADINNHAVSTYAKGEHILLLNNDIEIITPDWIESMLEFSQRDDVGCVGAKLYYPNDTIQHAGIIIGLGGYAAHSHRMLPRDHPGYFNRLNVIQNLSAVTAACLMIKRNIFDEVNGLDAKNFKVAYNDVDFCLRVREKSYLNIFTPYAELYHHESISRGEESTPEKIARFQTEKDALHKRHGSILKNGDPYYNPGLTHDKEDFTLCLK